jgi:hypothetical protein
MFKTLGELSNPADTVGDNFLTVFFTTGKRRCQNPFANIPDIYL